MYIFRTQSTVSTGQVGRLEQCKVLTRNGWTSFPKLNYSQFAWELGANCKQGRLLNMIKFSSYKTDVDNQLSSIDCCWSWYTIFVPQEAIVWSGVTLHCPGRRPAGPTTGNEKPVLVGAERGGREEGAWSQRKYFKHSGLHHWLLTSSQW